MHDFMKAVHPADFDGPILVQKRKISPPAYDKIQYTGAFYLGTFLLKLIAHSHYAQVTLRQIDYLVPDDVVPHQLRFVLIDAVHPQIIHLYIT